MATGYQIRHATSSERLLLKPITLRPHPEVIFFTLAINAKYCTKCVKDF